MIKQGFEEGFTQRLIEGNISKLRPRRLRLYRLKLYRSEAGVGGRGQGEIIYSFVSRKNRTKCHTLELWRLRLAYKGNFAKIFNVM